MKSLTQKQENFCLSYVEQGNASEAYRQSYNTAKMKPESVQRKATELMATGTITARIKELRAAAAERNEITVDDLIAELQQARAIALSAMIPQTSAAIAATMGKAKLLGMDKQILEHTGNVSFTKIERIIVGKK